MAKGGPSSRYSMRHGRAQHFPENVRSKFLEWEAYLGGDGHVHIKLTVPGQGAVHAVMQPEDAYELQTDIGHAYDQANGI